MTYDNIRFEIDGGVATLTLHRPDKLNAFTVPMLEECRHALSAADGDPSVRALLLTGAGRAFCAGQDLGERTVIGSEDAPPDLGQSLESRYNPVIKSIRGLRLPVVCAVNGVAAGAGANLALACDIVFAARSAQFVQAFARVGLIPDSGGTFFLPRLVGTARALGLALTAAPLSAEQAAEWGLIWECVDDDQLMEKATGLAAELAAGPTEGFALIKEAINQSTVHTLDQQLDLERDLQRAAGRTQDYREGVAAFMEKRTPDFRGN
ncbi:MAG: 2-(1,2-epoxy-1,2-dihydrophenyl)acetyl-CoA isomerase PaaG [Acidimicrobiia bacterium]